MIWLAIVFLALLPRAFAQFAIQKWPERHGAILIGWAAFSLGFVPYILFPALRELMSVPGITDAIYFGLFIVLAIHFEWKFGPRPKSEDDELD